ncbi:MAG: NTP transferase domain-containing protein [Gemmatimonadetes bacterium]|jgi:NDP-mannose synthase|nr:NTP transferase domain-containing protein [Gemmatimonadota bacterium]
MKAVILAGGLGTRLKPFTEVIPKPLLPVGESSVLEIQIMSLKRCGFDEIIIATNYRAEYVQAFLGNGDKLGVKLSFSKEEKPLGTCGPVLLLRDVLTEPFLLINGDILTTLDFRQIYDFAQSIDSVLAVATREMITPFNFGKVMSEGDFITDVQEKPDFHLEILAGIYVMKTDVFDMIPPDTYYGMDSLIRDMLSRKEPIARYYMKDYWLDIGQLADYEEAQGIYDEHFVHLKSEEDQAS